MMSAMSDPNISSRERAEGGRYMLLPEDPSTQVASTDSRRPRVRRYRLTRLGGDARALTAPGRLPAGDFAYLRRPHD